MDADNRNRWDDLADAMERNPAAHRMAPSYRPIEERVAFYRLIADMVRSNQTAG